jgi:hypothetical protein
MIGIGIHPFGRHAGVSGLQMAAVEARAAMADAGVRWEEIDFAAGGSDAAGNADPSVAALGLTGIPFSARPRRARQSQPGGRARVSDEARNLTGVDRVDRPRAGR